MRGAGYVPPSAFANPEHRLRRALFQIHLWTALFTGLYVLVISISGSAVVFRRELWRGIEPPYPAWLRFVEWLVDLHDNLLGGSLGTTINGIGALLVILLLFTGAILWWRGTRRWWWGMVLSRPMNSLRFLRQLHSFIGFWAFALLLLWALTAVYFAFPEPFEASMDYFDDNLDDAHRPGEWLLLQAIRLHFGRFGGWQMRTLWVVLGLLPAALFITGFLTWWRRQSRNRRRDQNFKRTPA